MPFTWNEINVKASAIKIYFDVQVGLQTWKEIRKDEYSI